MSMYWQHKVSWSGVLIIAGIAKVNEKEGDTLSDAITIASTTIAVGSIWHKELRFVLAGAVVATPFVIPVVAVVATTYVIGGLISFAAADPDDPGWYGAEALKEYYHDPIGTTKDIIEETATETYHSTKNAVTVIYSAIEQDVERRYQEKKRELEAGWQWVEENWRWYNPSPLPF